jgi:hypothetical protein
MKKPFIIFILSIVIICLFFNFIPNASCQSDNVKVLSYSWYYNSEYNDVLVIGEVQNIGPNNIEFIALNGTINSLDGEDQTWSRTVAYAHEILPQQKAPFRMYFFADYSYSEQFNWTLGDYNNIQFEVLAIETENYQYPNLEIVDNTHQIDATGLYSVTGTVKNTGDETAGKLWVVATFYNATGDIIATGFSDYLSPDFLEPNQTASFSLNTVDAFPDFSPELRQIPYKIKDYSLSIQTEAPIIPEFPLINIIVLLVLITSSVMLYFRIRLIKKTKYQLT